MNLDLHTTLSPWPKGEKYYCVESLPLSELAGRVKYFLYNRDCLFERHILVLNNRKIIYLREWICVYKNVHLDGRSYGSVFCGGKIACFQL